MIVLPSVSSGVISSSFFDPKKISGLALWLKADAGVSKFSYNYVSQIIITGTSNPSFAGTYTANGVPTYNFDEGFVDVYSFTGPAGKTMSWSSDDNYFILNSDGVDSFISYDGVNWTIINSYIAQIVITGFSGIYAGANGTYNGNGNDPYFTRVGGGFFIDGDGLKDTESETLIATPPANYSGSWTPTNYTSKVALSGATNSTSINGDYNATESIVVDSWGHSNGGYIYIDGGYVVTNNDWSNAYFSAFSANLLSWGVYSEGTNPAPSGTVTNTARSVGSPTSTSSTLPSGSISGSGIITTTVNTDYVDSWVDQSGNGRSPYVDAENRPTYTIIGGKSFVNLAGSRLFLSSVIWSDVEFIGTIFFVVRFNSSSAVYGSVLFHQEGNNGNLYFIRGIDSTNNFYITKNDGADVVSSNVLADNNTNYILATTFNASTASLYLNGASAGSGPISSSTGYPVNSSIGYGQSEQFNVAEAIIYNRVLTNGERQQVEAYLNAKYVIY